MVKYNIYSQTGKGRQSLQSKRKKRKLQKARKRKKFSQPTQDIFGISTDSTLPSEVMQTQCDVSSQPTEVHSSNMACGEDLVALEMRLEDHLKKEGENYSYDYLIECRQRLCAQVEQYKNEVERLSSTLTEQSAQHRQQLDQVREFYRTIAYARNRSGTIVKKSLIHSSPAADLMRELDAQYGSKYNM